MEIDWTPRHIIADRRIRKVLSNHTVANMRTLEQKISDSGPPDLRVDPHILTEARNSLSERGIIAEAFRGQTTWYYLSEINTEILEDRLSILNTLHLETKRQNFNMRLGQTLEIAVFRALKAQSELTFFGGFSDLDAHDDSTLYKKVEPPSVLSGKFIPSAKQLDFLIQGSGGYGGIEVKNLREWLYPDRSEIREMLLKCCALDVVPVLIARRIHFSTFAILNPCGVITHETYNQLYPNSNIALAEQVRNKDLLGYHDIRVGNLPDERLMRFIGKNLPSLLSASRNRFDFMKDLLEAYGNQRIDYPEFAEQVKLRIE